MHIFYRPLYKSDVTQFIDQLIAKDPGIEARQREGRELLWDKPVNREAWQEYRAGAGGAKALRLSDRRQISSSRPQPCRQGQAAGSR